MQSVVQKVDTQWNANEYQRILNDVLNRESREKNSIYGHVISRACR
jgi:hypothetical protein